MVTQITSLNNLFQRLTTNSVKKFCPVPNLNPLRHNFRLFPLALSLAPWERRPTAAGDVGMRKGEGNVNFAADLFRYLHTSEGLEVVKCSDRLGSEYWSENAFCWAVCFALCRSMTWWTLEIWTWGHGMRPRLWMWPGKSLPMGLLPAWTLPRQQLFLRRMWSIMWNTKGEFGTFPSKCWW